MGRARWLHLLLIALVIEKIVQHIVVTLAFYWDWRQIRSSVVVDGDILMVAGALIAFLFVVALWALLSRRRWALDLVILLALVDIVGEFVAQGTVAIVTTVSFLVAVALLILGLVYRRGWKVATGAVQTPQ
jgi:hypothetical protein